MALLFPLHSLASDLTNSNKFFDFAEREYANYFSPSGSSTYELSGYLVRYYAGTQNYLGTKKGEVFVYGNIFNGLLKVGEISDFVTLEPNGDDILAELYEAERSNIQVQGEGTVRIVLSDDLDGSRHQRFIVELASGQTLLLAHNIDLAPRIETLSADDYIEFSGEYEWNEKGGVIHWTHYDPEGIHEDGWILHNNTLYQRLP